MQLTFLTINYEINDNPVSSRTIRRPSSYFQWYAYHWLKSTVLDDTAEVTPPPPRFSILGGKYDRVEICA
jgi:hypothetical protein